MSSKALQAVLVAGALSSCASYSLTSVRPTYSDPHLEVSCAVFPNDKAELNGRLAALYEEGWRLAAAGSKNMLGSEPFLCFERPAGEGKPVAKAKPAPKPPPPPVEEEAVEEEAPPAKAAPAAPPKKAVKKAPVEEPVEEAVEPAPKPVKKPRKPVLDE